MTVTLPAFGRGLSLLPGVYGVEFEAAAEMPENCLGEFDIGKGTVELAMGKTEAGRDRSQVISGEIKVATGDGQGIKGPPQDQRFTGTQKLLPQKADIKVDVVAYQHGRCQ